MSTTEINGLRIHYELVGDEGPPGQRQVVAFLNGVMMTTQSWVLQTGPLRRRYRCLLHDFRGQLLSDKPDQPWSLAAHADDFRALLDHLEIETCHVVGTSYGGEVGLIFASLWPERVKSLSVISAVSEVGADLDRAVASWGEAARDAPQSLYRVALPLNFSPRFIAANPQVIEQGEERVRGCPSEFFAGLGRLIDAFRELDITAELGKVSCPTLVLVGEDDALKPVRYSRLLAERIPNSELLIVPDAGHAVIIEKPAEINTALLGFIEKHSRVR